MARARRRFAPGLVYHVIARGNHREQIFLCPRDYAAYLRRIASYARDYEIVIYAYCLMPNHVHLLIRVGGTPIWKFMQGLQQSYTQYFNLAYRTVGHLFQGRYRAITCDTDEYLASLLRYIHLNPVRAGLASRPERHPYNSHRIYLSARPTTLVDPRPILEVLGGPAAYHRLVQDDAPRNDRSEMSGDPSASTPAAGPLQVPKASNPGRPPLSLAMLTLATNLRVDADRLAGDDRGRSVSRARLLVAYTLSRRLGYPLSAVATELRRRKSTMSVVVSRFSARVAISSTLQAETARLAELLTVKA
jgi:putative transposase